MWHALRAELAYLRPWLLGGLGIAAGVVVLLSVVLRLFAEGKGVPSIVPAMFPIIAGMVVAFIAQTQRFEERRARLLLAGPLTPRQLAGVTVLLPACLVGLGALAAVLMLGLAALVTGRLELATPRSLGVNTAQFFAYAQMGPLVLEATAAHRQGRGRAAIAGWSSIVVAIALLMAFFWYGNQPTIYILGYLIFLSMIMAATVVLYQGRTDFTR